MDLLSVQCSLGSVESSRSVDDSHRHWKSCCRPASRRTGRWGLRPRPVRQSPRLPSPRPCDVMPASAISCTGSFSRDLFLTMSSISASSRSYSASVRPRRVWRTIAWRISRSVFGASPALLQRDLELGEVVDQLGCGEQLESCRVDHPDLLALLSRDRRVPEHHDGVLGELALGLRDRLCDRGQQLMAVDRIELLRDPGLADSGARGARRLDEAGPAVLHLNDVRPCSAAATRPDPWAG